MAQGTDPMAKEQIAPSRAIATGLTRPASGGTPLELAANQLDSMCATVDNQQQRVRAALDALLGEESPDTPYAEPERGCTPCMEAMDRGFNNGAVGQVLNSVEALQNRVDRWVYIIERLERLT